MFCSLDMGWMVFVVLAASACASPPAPPAPPAVESLDDFRSAVQKVLRPTPVTAETHFRAGSISKTFIAMALVQLSKDGDLDLDTAIAEIASEVPFQRDLKPENIMAGAFGGSVRDGFGRRAR